MQRRFTSSAAAATAVSTLGLRPAAHAADTIKVACCTPVGHHAISETVLKDTVLMAIDEINAKAACWQEARACDRGPGLQLPLFAEKTKQLLGRQGGDLRLLDVVSRKSVLPVVEEMTACCSTVQYEVKSCPRTCSTPVPRPTAGHSAVDYLMSKDGGAPALGAAGTDYVPRTTKQICAPTSRARA